MLGVGDDLGLRIEGVWMFKTRLQGQLVVA